MKQLVDFFPIVIFAAVYFIERDMILATAVLIAASAIQIILDWLIWKEKNKTHLITFGVLLLLGGATVFLQDETFVKWKPSAVYWIFAIVLFGSQFIGKKNIVERLLGALLNSIVEKTEETENTETNAQQTTTNPEANFEVKVPKLVWRNLNIAWISFFTFLGFLNIYVAYNFDNDTWVSFKLIGITIANIVFLLAQLPFLMKYLPNEEELNNS